MKTQSLILQEIYKYNFNNQNIETLYRFFPCNLQVTLCNFMGKKFLLKTYNLKRY